MATRDPNIREYDLSKTLDFVTTEAIRNQVKTMLPGVVESYDPETKRARIQPALKRVYNDRPPADRAMLLDVPVVCPATGGIMVHQPIKKGDVVMVLFSERGLEEFKRTWTLSLPTAGKFFDDAVAMRWGVENLTPIDADAFMIQSEDGQTYIKLKDGLIELKCGTKMIRMTPNRGDMN